MIVPATGGVFFGRTRCPELTPELAGVGLVIIRVVRGRVLCQVVPEIRKIVPIDDLYEHPDHRPKELKGEQQPFANPFEKRAEALTERVRRVKPYRKSTGPACVVLDAMFTRAIWVDGLYDEFAAETSGRADIYLFLSVFDGFFVSGVAVAGDQVFGTLARRWEEAPGPATGDWGSVSGSPRGVMYKTYGLLMMILEP